MKMRAGLVAEVSVSQTEILASGSRKFLLYEHSSLVTKTKMIHVRTENTQILLPFIQFQATDYFFG